MIEEDTPLNLKPILIGAPIIALLLIAIYMFVTLAANSAETVTDNRSKAAEVMESIRYFEAVKSEQGNLKRNQYAKPPFWSSAAGPAVIKDADILHMFFCTNQDSTNNSYIRYTTSGDNGKTWSAPEIKVKLLDSPGSNQATCNPAIVFFQNYYYLFYSTVGEGQNQIDPHFISVARSTKIDGEYSTLTQKGTWENNAAEPKKIITPFTIRNNAAATKRYMGVGNPSVVNKDNKLIMWYTDDTVATNGVGQTYMVESSNPAQWVTDKSKQISPQAAHTVNIKYDTKLKRYINLDIIADFGPSAQVQASYSTDGLKWQPYTIIMSTELPKKPQQPATVSDKFGTLNLEEPLFVAFTADTLNASASESNNQNIYSVFVDSKSLLPKTTTK